MTSTAKSDWRSLGTVPRPWGRGQNIGRYRRLLPYTHSFLLYLSSSPSTRPATLPSTKWFELSSQKPQFISTQEQTGDKEVTGSLIFLYLPGLLMTHERGIAKLAQFQSIAALWGQDIHSLSFFCYGISSKTTLLCWKKKKKKRLLTKFVSHFHTPFPWEKECQSKKNKRI